MRQKLAIFNIIAIIGITISISTIAPYEVTQLGSL
ncbi:Uncharacterised protein [Staphylococcus xylosus]|nr:Uncharacterised protein [Staphylococcus xylosus]